MKKVLITSVSRKVALVQAFKQAGWYVIGFDIDPEAVALKFCDEAVCLPRYNIDGNDSVYLVAMSREIDLLVPTRDAELLEFSTWGNTPFKIMIPSRETIETCVDKLKFYHWAKANGFKTPEVHFVKPRISKSGKDVECVWQEVIEGKEYSIDLFADFEGNVISVVPRQRLRIVSGESTVTRTVLNDALQNSCASLSSKLGLIGHNCIQCFVSASGEVIWTDINCRFGGASAVGIEAGCQSPLWLKQLVEGELVESQIGKPKEITGMSYTDWSYYAVEVD